MVKLSALQGGYQDKQAIQQMCEEHLRSADKFYVDLWFPVLQVHTKDLGCHELRVAP